MWSAERPGALGIGATGDYWLSGLAARNDMSRTVAGIVANDAALPARALTALRSVLVAGRRVATAGRAGRATVRLGIGVSVMKLMRPHPRGRE